MSLSWQPSIGAQPERDGVRFRVWAPGHDRVDVVIYGPDAETTHRLEPEPDGYFAGRVQGIGAGARYRFRLNGGDSFPDPASRSQPDGVHGPSEVVDPSTFRSDVTGWRGRPLEEYVLYELHMGTATPEGTFDALTARLADLEKLGITALEIMPIAEFPGDHNWGYDGVDLFAPSSRYGGPAAFRRLVDAAHRHGLAVVLDVVYNHFGPEGNYLPAFTNGRIFTERHHTPWGAAINYDGRESGPVREFVIENALHWIHNFDLDGLRFDAIHVIIDDSPVHILQELTTRLRASVAPDRHLVLIAEDERNERRTVMSVEEGGLGFDAVWADDFHHQLRRLIAGDREGYFRYYSGGIDDLVLTLRQGWYDQGQYSETRGDRRGTPAEDLPSLRFVHCIQNHDQVGNRAWGDRLNHAIDLAAYRAASALLLLSPYSPLLWMGQEWAASTPFLYFTDHPEDLGRRVTEGRREEFKHFSAFADPEVRERIPDPQAETTFLRSKLRWDERELAPHEGVACLYRELIALRRIEPLRLRTRDSFRVVACGHEGLALRRQGADGSAVLFVASFRGPLRLDLAAHEETRPPRAASWNLLLSSEEARFGGGEGQAAKLTDGHTLELPGPGAAVLRSG